MLYCQNENHFVPIQEGSNEKLKLVHVCTEYSQFEHRKYTTTTTINRDPNRSLLQDLDSFPPGT